MFSPQKIAAIKALAEDERGEPNTRAAAKLKLEQIRTQHPSLMENVKAILAQNPLNPRMQHRQDFSKWRFMDMGNWKATDKGNYTILVECYRVTLFKKMGEWRWSIKDVTDDRRKPKFGGDFDLIGEAQRDAWENLQTI